MAKTPISSVTPYCDVAMALKFRDVRQWADLCSDEDTRGNATTLANTGAADGARMEAILFAASGEVEEHCFKGGRYTAADLAALQGNGSYRLKEIVADLAYWRAAKRRWPKLRLEDVSGAKEALEALQRLGSGETLFGFAESVSASNPSVTTLDPGDDRRTVRAAARMFGRREPRGLDGSG